MSQPRWFIIHVYSGFEKKVKELIKEQAEQKGLGHLFEEILVPMEEVVEVRRGKKVAAERKFFPGYVMVKMALNDETWSLVRNTAKVTGFLGPGGKPSPIPDHEADRIRNQIAGGRRAPQAHDRLHVRRQCPRRRRPVRLVQRGGRGGRRGQGPAQGVGLDLRPGDPGRAGVLAGREALAPSFHLAGAPFAARMDR